MRRSPRRCARRPRAAPWEPGGLWPGAAPVLAAGLADRGERARIVFVLLPLVVSIPIGLWLAVRWAFIPHSCMIDDRCGWDATRASADAVRGTWWRTAVFAGVLNVIAYGLGAVIGVAVLLVTNASPQTINIAGALVFMLAIPYVALCYTLMYLDRTADG